MFAASKTASVSGGYQISRSLRFNSADSAYLNRTPASASNQKTWTWSGWVKRSALRANLSDPATLFNAGGNGFNARFSYANPDQLEFYNYSGAAFQLNLATTAVYRDVSAWYHIVFALDTTQATDTNRFKVYVNGTQITAFSTATYPSQNSDMLVNGTTVHALGVLNGIGGYYSGYMTEVNFIDGQALTPSSFGETNAQTGVWQPKAYSGSYGTNGFYLNFSDNSNTTAATLGKDYSGNSNNWTPNNFSVTAGAGNDSLVDSPTSYGTDTGVGGTVRGNYATLNPLKKKSVATISNGNLNLNATSATYVTGLSTISPSSGNYYMEMLCTGNNSNRPWGIGVVQSNASSEASINDSNTYFVTNNSGSTVNYFLGATQTALSTSSTWVVNDIISLAWNVDSGKFWVARNGVWYPSSTGGTVASNADVAAGNFPTFTISYSANTNPQVIPAFVTYDTTAPVDVNFGQRPFAYTAPSGFKALCTQNLPTPTIGATTATQANLYFNPVLYTGDRTDRTITVGFQPDWVWVKSRNAVDDHYLMNAVVGTGKYLNSNSTASETTNANSLTAYTSTGFSVGNTGTTNETGRTYVAWNWKANGSGSTNTSGSITSTVSANTTSGFSVVTYTGNGSFGSVGHGLGAVPAMVIIKTRNNVYDWLVYHQSLGFLKTLFLNSSSAAVTATEINNSSSTTMTVQSEACTASNNYVAYCFAEVAGFSKFGSYTGNGSADGPFIFTGFKPAFVLIKSSTVASASWRLWDAKRSTYNVVNSSLFPNLSNAEVSTADYAIDFLSNGIKIRAADDGQNYNGGTFIYAAFAEAPQKFSLAR
jgi:hypothetical protein